jgi:hypothetical protein
VDPNGLEWTLLEDSKGRSRFLNHTNARVACWDIGGRLPTLDEFQFFQSHIQNPEEIVNSGRFWTSTQMDVSFYVGTETLDFIAPDDGRRLGWIDLPPTKKGAPFIRRRPEQISVRQEEIYLSDSEYIACSLTSDYVFRNKRELFMVLCVRDSRSEP